MFCLFLVFCGYLYVGVLVGFDLFGDIWFFRVVLLCVLFAVKVDFCGG